MRVEKKHHLAKLRRWRVRKKVLGTRQRPRLSVHFSHQHVYVQFVDDEAGQTLAAASSRTKSLPDRDQLGANVKGAQKVGALAAEVAKSKGIEQVIFDRGGARYHGKVKALADAARQGGLKF